MVFERRLEREEDADMTSNSVETGVEEGKGKSLSAEKAAKTVASGMTSFHSDRRYRIILWKT